MLLSLLEAVESRCYCSQKLDTRKNGDAMQTDNEFSKEQVLAYITSWKESLELRRNEIYAKHLRGAVGGILLVIVTIGLSFDKLAQFGIFEKLLLGASLLCLLMSTGWVMHGMTFTINAQLNLLQYERAVLTGSKLTIPRTEVESWEKELVEGRDRAHEFFPHAYVGIVVAIGLGIIGFFTILVKA